jgi:hypothetical protein
MTGGVIYNYVLVTTPSSATSVRRISDLQRSAFWIYGVTAMVMREPFGLIIRHTTEAGLGNWQVRLELLRVTVILFLLARLFLVSGLYFETVYMQPDSSERYPRRSYPTDFLAGLAQFLVGAAATTAIGLHSRISQSLAPFTLTVALFLLIDAGWLAVAQLRAFSSTGLIRREASRNFVILAAATLLSGISRLSGADTVLSDQIALFTIAAGTGFDVLQQIRIYESLDK